MNAGVGDRIVLESERAARPPRAGIVEEVLYATVARYRVRWTDGRTSIITPASGCLWFALAPPERPPGDSL
jgi:hypothetical protein